MEAEEDTTLRTAIRQQTQKHGLSAVVHGVLEQVQEAIESKQLADEFDEEEVLFLQRDIAGLMDTFGSILSRQSFLAACKTHNVPEWLLEQLDLHKLALNEIEGPCRDCGGDYHTAYFADFHLTNGKPVHIEACTNSCRFSDKLASGVGLIAKIDGQTIVEEKDEADEDAPIWTHRKTKLPLHGIFTIPPELAVADQRALDDAFFRLLATVAQFTKQLPPYSDSEAQVARANEKAREDWKAQRKLHW